MQSTWLGYTPKPPYRSLSVSTLFARLLGVLTRPDTNPSLNSHPGPTIWLTRGRSTAWRGAASPQEYVWLFFPSATIQKRSATSANRYTGGVRTDKRNTIKRELFQYWTEMGHLTVRDQKRHFLVSTSLVIFSRMIASNDQSVILYWNYDIVTKNVTPRVRPFTIAGLRMPRGLKRFPHERNHTHGSRAMPWAVVWLHSYRSRAMDENWHPL